MQYQNNFLNFGDSEKRFDINLGCLGYDNLSEERTVALAPSDLLSLE